MVICLAVMAALGMLGCAYWMLRIIQLAVDPNGGLAVTLALGPLGSSLIFTAVCLAGAGIMHAVSANGRELRVLRSALEAGFRLRPLEPGIPSPPPPPPSTRPRPADRDARGFPTNPKVRLGPRQEPRIDG